MSIKNEEKAQTALEYLLIMAAVIIVAVVVTVLLNQMTTIAKHEAQTGVEQYQNALNEMRNTQT